MSIPLVEPRDGLPPLCESPDQFHEALARLEAGNGPLAIDTERASGIRYGNRAFLVQIRRAGCGTVLFDAEQHRTELGEILKPLLNSTTWVLHAAVSDLPSLQNFGWFPTRLFDTEVAGRLAGFDQVNLAAMVEKVLGLHLAKGLAQSDWSRRPIPAAWLTYAALDVEVLLELADSMAAILAADGKTAWAEQEFEHIRLQARQPQAESTWQDMKGSPHPLLSWRRSLAFPKTRVLRTAGSGWYHRPFTPLASSGRSHHHRSLPLRAAHGQSTIKRLPLLYQMLKILSPRSHPATTCLSRMSFPQPLSKRQCGAPV